MQESKRAPGLIFVAHLHMTDSWVNRFMIFRMPIEMCSKNIGVSYLARAEFYRSEISTLPYVMKMNYV